MIAATLLPNESKDLWLRVYDSLLRALTLNNEMKLVESDGKARCENALALGGERLR